MNCPRCGNEMNEVIKHSVVIDVCAGCGGIWLDKGEMAKILTHMKTAEEALEAEFQAVRPQQKVNEGKGRGYEEERSHHDRHEHDEYRREHDKHYDKQGYDSHKYAYRKKSGLQKLFDIFD